MCDICCVQKLYGAENIINYDDKMALLSKFKVGGLLFHKQLLEVADLEIHDQENSIAVCNNID